MGKPTKKNIRRKNRRTRRKVNKKKMKKGGVSFRFNQSIGLCNADETLGTMIQYSDNGQDITTGKFLNETGLETATIKKICKDKTNQNTITFLINIGPLQYKRMTPEEFKKKYIYYQPSLNEKKFEYKIEGAILSKKFFQKKTFSMFNFFGKNKK